MYIMNIHEAKTHFSKLIEAVLNGEEVTIAKAGKPVVQLRAIKQNKPNIKIGLLKGKITIDSHFDDPLPPEVLAGFTGSNT